MHKVVTMDDIAAELKISKSTVSRALAGSGRISVDTIQKVTECAERLGFKPNLVAKALAGKKTLNLAAVMPAEANGTQMMFFHECLSGMVIRAEKDGYNILVCMTRDGEGGSDSLSEILKYGKVDAVVLTQLRRDDRNLAILKDSDVPFVVLGSGAGDDVVQVDSRIVDNCADFTEKCVSQIEDNDSKDVLFVCGTLDILANNNRLLGFLSGMERACANKKKSVQYAICTDVFDFADDNEISKWGMILCADDVVCVHMMQILRLKGIVPGRDVKVASFHDGVLLETANPSVTALKVDAFALGENACDKAISIASGKKVEMMSYVDCSIQVRDTLKI